MSVDKVRSSKLVALVLLAGIEIAHAAPNSCNVGVSAVSFGTYDSTSGTDLLATGTINLSCNNKSVHVVLKLNAGIGVGTSFATGRMMTRLPEGGTMIYNLYTNSGRSQIFGDGTGGSASLPLIVNKTKAQTIWARIPGSQTSLLAGNYSDTVTVTITY